VRLFDRIQVEFGQSIPLLLMFKDGTVEALSKYLTRDEKSSVTKELCRFNRKGMKSHYS